MALRLRQRLLAAFNWIFVCCLLVVLFSGITIKYGQVLRPVIRSIGSRKHLGYFALFLLVFITLKVIVLKKMCSFFNFTVFILFV